MAALCGSLAHHRSQLCYQVHGGIVVDFETLQTDGFHGMTWESSCMQTSSAASSSAAVDLAGKKQVQHICDPIFLGVEALRRMLSRTGRGPIRVASVPAFCWQAK